MGLVSGTMAIMSGQKALRTHVAGNRLSNEGKVGAARDRYEEARRLYERAIRQGNGAPNVHLGYAVLLLRLGDFEKAHDVMQGMRALPQMTEKDWFELRLNYSIYLWRIGKLDEAIDTINRAAKTARNSAVYATLGIYLVDKARETGETGEAMSFNREALDYDDEDAAALDNMGALREVMMEQARAKGDAAGALEQRAAALACYEKAHAANPRQITTAYALAKLYHEDGEDGKARQVLSDAGNLFFSALCPVTESMMDELKKAVG